ncbi:uncharacterized protein ACIBXB_002077 [Morphnus guianensis]
MSHFPLFRKETTCSRIGLCPFVPPTHKEKGQAEKLLLDSESTFRRSLRLPMRLTSHRHDEECQDAGLSPCCTIAVEQDIKCLSQISSEHHRDLLHPLPLAKK